MLKYLRFLRFIAAAAVAVGAILGSGLADCRWAYGTDPITATVKANRGVGVGFDLLGDAAVTGTVKLKPEADWYIVTNQESSSVKDKSGTTFWERNSATENEHVWIGYGLCNDASGKANARNFVYSRTYARFEGELFQKKSGNKATQSSFTASVADLDLSLPNVADIGEADEPNGGLYCPNLYPKGTRYTPFPDVAPDNCVPLNINLHLSWAGPPIEPPTFGELTLVPSGAGANGIAIYNPDGTPFSSGSLSITPAKLTNGTYTAVYKILTNYAFTGPTTIDGVFTWDTALAGGPPTAKDAVRLMPVEWKAWPGGQSDDTLNPTETFSSGDFGLVGNVNWDVGQGGIPAVISETGATTATDINTITVRYNVQSPTAGMSDTVQIRATSSAGTRVVKMRTVFKVTWLVPKVQGDLDTVLRFSPDTGTDTDKCGFNWKGDNGAEWVSAKIQSTIIFNPAGIDWDARGVTFAYGTDTGKFHFRLGRKMIRSVLKQGTTAANRSVDSEGNDQDWERDAYANNFDTQYPNSHISDRAFVIDAPGFSPDDLKQETWRVDFWDIAEWHNGFAWSQISTTTNAYWHCNITGVLPNCARSGTNNHNPDIPAENVSNTKPVANAGADQNVKSQVEVTLHGSGTDADNDTLTYKWTQTGGPNVTLSSDTAKESTFTTPAGSATLEFSLKVSDITKGLFWHNPNTYESDADTVTINVSP